MARVGIFLNTLVGLCRVGLNTDGGWDGNLVKSVRTAELHVCRLVGNKYPQNSCAKSPGPKPLI